MKQLSFLKKESAIKLSDEQEHQPVFVKYRNKHSAVESNINELEHRGLNRCPDKGYKHFKRYNGLAVCAYNLKKIGNYLIVQEREQNTALDLRQAA